jgi:anthranilate synthase component 2
VSRARRPSILIIDNYDSFTFNLVQYLGELGAQVEVVRNDAIDLPGIAAKRVAGLVLSPGPGTPDEAGVTLAAIRAFAGRIPILGICLGHQAIGQAFGARVVRNRRVIHGKASLVLHRGRGVFRGLPSPLAAGRYHSLVVEARGLPSSLRVTAWTKEREIMGLAHRRWAVEGVQFHPESVLTEGGKQLLGNWLGGLSPNLARSASQRRARA